MIRTDLIVRRPDPMANYVIVSGRTRVAQLWLGKHCEGGLTGDGLMVDQRMISDIIDGFKNACADDEVFLRYRRRVEPAQGAQQAGQNAGRAGLRRAAGPAGIQRRGQHHPQRSEAVAHVVIPRYSFLTVKTQSFYNVNF